MVRRIPGLLLIAVGAVFLIWTLAANLFAVGPAFDDLTADFRPMMSDQAIATAQQDVAGLAAVSDELSNSAVPFLAGALGTTPAELAQTVAAEYPAVAAGMTALPTVVPTFEGVVGMLEAQQSNFEQADAIPTTALPTTTVPWTLLVVGILAAGLGAWFVARPMQLDATLAVGLGIVLVAGPLLMSIPGKAAAADDMNEAFAPVYTETFVAQGAAALGTIEAMATEIQTQMLPDIAAQLELTQEELTAFMGESLPATTAALASLPPAMARMDETVTAFAANLDNYEVLRPVAFTPVAWMMIIGGLAIVFAGALPLFVERFSGEPIHWHRAHPTPA